jgi:hypothetical protein
MRIEKNNLINQLNLLAMIKNKKNSIIMNIIHMKIFFLICFIHNFFSRKNL